MIAWVEQHPVLMITIPALIVWAFLVYDVLSKSELSPVQRAVWMGAITLFFPLGLLWLLVRPGGTPGVRESSQPDPADPRVRFVALVLAHQRGEIDDASFQRAKDQFLRR